MHVLSELRNPLFDTPDRQQAVRALQTARLLRENSGSKAWQAIQNMIDRAVADYNSSPQSQSQSSGSVASPPRSKLEDPSNDNLRVYPAMGAIPSYAMQVSSGQYTPDPITTDPQQIQPNPNLLPPMRQAVPQQPVQQQPIQQQPVQQQPLQQFVQPNWDDFNLNNIINIVGDVQPTPGIMPDFDFVSAVTV
jgi:hypothetical protein